MRRFTLAMLFVSPLVSALEVTDVTYSNIREGTVAGRVTADMKFTVNHRNMNDSTAPEMRLRSQCTPYRDVFGAIYTADSYLLFQRTSNAPIPASGSTYVTLNQVYSGITPDKVTYNQTLTNVLADSPMNIQIQLGTAPRCFSTDSNRNFKTPRLTADCHISVQSNMTHGALTLPGVGNSHTANGAVQVVCDKPADVTVSTGHSGSLRINDTLSTDISVNGSPNSATKTVNGTELFTVSSRLYRTSASNWGGSFSQPVVMTISWP